MEEVAIAGLETALLTKLSESLPRRLGQTRQFEVSRRNQRCQALVVGLDVLQRICNDPADSVEPTWRRPCAYADLDSPLTKPGESGNSLRIAWPEVSILGHLVSGVKPRRQNHVMQFVGVYVRHDVPIDFQKKMPENTLPFPRRA
jgi:hypothetical protein